MLEQGSKAEETYRLVLTGEIRDGYGKAKAVRNLASILKVPVEQAVSMLMGKPICIKRQLDIDDAQKYQKIFYAKGIGSRIEGDINQEAAGPAARKNSEPKPQQLSAASAEPKNNKTESKKTAPEPIQLSSPLSEQRLPFSLRLHILLSTFGAALVTLLYIALGCGFILGIIERTLGLVLSASALSLPQVAAFYITPIILYTLVFILYLRPLLPFRKPLEDGYETDQSLQPRFFSYLKSLCSNLDLPAPEKVFFTSTNTVEAEFESGIAPLKEGNTQLKIGLCLLHQLNSRQLSASIANRLWYFKYPAYRYFIAFVKQIYTRSKNAARGQDGWETWLSLKQDATNGGSDSYFLTLSKALLFLSEKLSAVFHYLTAVSCAGLLRKLQLHADDFEAELCGSESKAEILLSLERSQHASNEVIRKLLGTPGPLKLVNDLPALVHHSVNTQSHELIKMLKDDMRMKQAKWWQDQPSPRDRILRSEDLDASPTLNVAITPLELIENYPEMSEELSLLHYESLGVYVNSDELVDVIEITATDQKKLIRGEKTQQYFNGWFRREIFWPLQSPKKIHQLSAEKKLSLLKDAIIKIRKSTQEYLKLLAELPLAKEKIRKLSTANEIKKSGYGIPKEYFDPKNTSSANFSAHFTKIKAEYQDILQKQKKFSELMGLRTVLAASLSQSKRDLSLSYKYIEILRALAEQRSNLNKVQMAVSFLPIADARIKEKKELNHQTRIQRITRDVFSKCGAAIQNLEHYDWVLSDDFSSAADYVRAHARPIKLNENTTIAATVDYYQRMVLAIESANELINGELCAIAQNNEEHHKLPKIKIALT